MSQTRRRRIAAGAGALGIAAALAGPAAGATEEPLAPLVPAEGQEIEGQYIVLFEDDLQFGAAADSLDAAREHGITVQHEYTALGGYAASLDQQQLEQVRQDPNVAMVEEDSVVSVATDQTDATWGLDRVDQRSLPLDQVYSYDTTGAGVTSYIIDTGIRASHQQFDGRVDSGFTAIEDGNGTNDCNGHGTHVAGTVGGSIHGVAKDTGLVAVRVLDCQGSGTNSGVVAGMDWVADNASAGSVANMSLGGGASDATDAAVDRMVSSGVTVVVAAGNANTDACSSSPARAPAAITVGATDSSDSRSSFSNYGSCLDIFAPGSAITSAWHTSDTATNEISGTSMASPHVAGAAARYLESNPGASPAQVTDALVGNATPDVVGSPGAGSPNLLLFTGTDGGSEPDPDPEPEPSDLVNGGFEDGQTGWSSSSGVITGSGYPASSGSMKAWLNGYGQTSSDQVSQEVTVPEGGELSFHLRVVTQESTSSSAYDVLAVQVTNGDGASTEATFSNLDASGSYQAHSVDLSAYAGQTVTIRFQGDEDYALATSFLVDEVSLG